MKSIRFEVFGRNVLVVEKERGWEAFYTGSEGKRRPARDIVLPAKITESELDRYLEDLCHEWATDRNKEVKRLD